MKLENNVLKKVLKINVEIPRTVLVRLAVDTYPMLPNPVTVLVSWDNGRIFAVVLIKAPVETYLDGSRNHAVVLAS